jgi:phenylacetate-CoA ligase
MKDFKPTILTATPSYTLHLAEIGRGDGRLLADLHFKSGIFGAEPWSEDMREEIERKLHFKAIDIYGLSEIIGPGWPSNASRPKTGCTSSRTISSRKSSTRIPAKSCPYGRNRRTGHHHHHQGSLSGHPLPDPGHHLHLNPEPCVCGRTHAG